MEKPPFVVIVAIRGDEIATVRQYRYPIDRVTIELPKGLVDQGETPLQAAEREVREEMSHDPGSLELISTIAFASARCRCDCHIFLAKNPIPLEKEHPKDPTEEDLVLEWIPITTWRQMIKDGLIIDQDSIAAWCLYREKMM